ncbi:hypothetical protein [Sphingomonas sp.]|jgi:hypothetical protein|uniref:hypothetical protein n=1 Tax=Sphingomonas sp. TaxID=28214 RepID=UPI002D7FB2A1|nr:hypothetical protein [Sphingomonas sp.]HEU0044500.1 hypothetical protein [Sphingomonas sp.]
MLRISDAQLAGLEAAVRERMTRRATATAQARLAAAGVARTPDQIRPVAAEMQAFAEARDLREQASLDALLELRLSSWWRDPLPELAAMFLTRAGFPEPTRVEQFRQALIQPQVTLIDLDAPLPAAAR